MAEAKPTASLSSGLLARKGAARPAMRRQGLGGHISGGHDDLGWNDMGHEADSDESHAAHVAEIMPMLSPMGARHAPAHAERETDDAPETPVAEPATGPREAVSEIARSPLSVKPGKPQVVLQREALEARVATPAPAAAPDQAPASDDTPAAEAAEPVAAAPEPIVAEPPARPAPAEAFRAAPARAEPVSPEPVAAEPVRTERAAPRSIPRAAPAPDQPRAIRTPKKSRTPRASRPSGAKAAFTLRIDADRHLRLRLASAVTNLSAQQILTEAFDAYLDSIPEVEMLAGNVARHNADSS